MLHQKWLMHILPCSSQHRKQSLNFICNFQSTFIVFQTVFFSLECIAFQYLIEISCGDGEREQWILNATVCPVTYPDCTCIVSMFASSNNPAPPSIRFLPSLMAKAIKICTGLWAILQFAHKCFRSQSRPSLTLRPGIVFCFTNQPGKL